MPMNCRRRRDRHIAGLRHLAGDEGDGAARDIEFGGIFFAALLIDELVDRQCAH